ncbi:synaptic vesicle glycoprotein 2B-like [Trichoplusia ni]|uniref:Synaptic vesicle glycoprotein 2B-like n=1 Tax=Trichoplusia ni TaxID=7111 RepID=A0A7E5VFS4_TRINI|nr:synaptic vesicle glycoprotein 2B-like [Trichoplusia ni]
MEENKEENDENNGAYTYDKAVELTGHGCYNYLLLIACSITAYAFALDVFGFATVVAASSCDLQLGLREIGILVSAPFAGVLFAFPWGFYADTCGRRRALVVSTAVGFVFAAVSTLANSWQLMLVLKLIGCSFSTASFTLSMTILGECTGTAHRSQFLLIMNAFNIASEFVAFSLAYLILPLSFKFSLPWMGITFRPWRLYTLVMALPLGVAALFFLYLSESPKYLASCGEYSKALKVLKRMYKINGGKNDGFPVKHILPTDVSTKPDSSFWKTIAHHTVPMFKPPLLWRTIQLFFLLALCCSVNNVIVMWFPTMVNIFFNSFNGEQTADLTFCERMFQSGNTTEVASTSETYRCNESISTNTLYSGMLCGIFFFILNLSVARIASRPRLVLAAILAVAGVSVILVNLREPIANMVFFCLVQVTALGIGCVASYFVDLYPTHNRGLVTSLGMMVARLVSFTGVNVLGNVITNYCETTFYCLSSIAFFGVIVSLFLPSDRKNIKCDS